ncbi:hypothetical protein DSM104299_00259 [Baekduia alba]|nr:hypothetical protein DSM104299_00259 [Baekduia alba]
MDARDLHDRVFGDPKFLAWRNGATRLHLFLDSLDEAKIQVRKVVSMLQEALERCDLDRLVLRVACRTADRPTGFETWLKDAFGEERFRVLELAPLRVSETRAMASARGVDDDRFVQAAVTAGVAPLTARPLSLKMVLGVFEAEGGFPDTLGALYQDALLLMVGEDQDERRPLRTLSDTAGFAIAARIAAATVLAGRDVVGDGVDAVALRDLAGGDELDRLVAAETTVAVDERAVQEVLGTALFTGRAGGVGWAHRTFGEYLAAYWLAGDRLTDAQVADLMLVDDGTLAVAPPLRNVAGWLLGMRPTFQALLTPADALVLVYGDPASVAVEVRRALLPSLLDALDDQQVDRRGLRNLWRWVGYDGIADDLRATLLDLGRDDQTRQAAVDAAAELELDDLVGVLVDVALDPANSVSLRTSALYGLREFGDRVPRERIRPLALQPQPGDDDDEIKGAALHLCWPKAISAPELFAALTPEKNEALLGAYVGFLHGPCVEHLTEPEDLLLGIQWGLTVSHRAHDTRDVTGVADRIVAKAWPLAATVPDIAEALTDLIELASASFSPILRSPRSLRDDAPDSTLDDPQANAAIAAVLVERMAAGTQAGDVVERMVFRDFPREIDMSVVIERWAAAPSGAVKAAWVTCIPWLARGDRADAIYEVRDTYPELYELVAWRYEAIVLDSPEAEALRQQHAHLLDDNRPSSPPSADLEELDRHIAAELAAFANGNVDAFWRLPRQLFVDDDNWVRDEQTREDLADTPGWRRMSNETRSKLIDAAREYLLRADPETASWLGQDVFFRPARAGYLALKLLFNERRTSFDSLDASVWRRWAPVVIEPRRYGSENDRDAFHTVALACVRADAADVARDVTRALIPGRLFASDIDAARDRLGELWDTSFDDLLFAQLDRSDLERHEIYNVVSALLAVDYADAEDWAASRITSAQLVGDEDQRELALDLAGALAAHAPRRLWPMVESIVGNDDVAGRILLSRLIDRSESGWEGALEPAELARLFGLLRRLFPPDPDAPDGRTFAVTIEMQASFWQSRIVERLVAEGTRDAVSVVAALAAKHDDNGWLRRMYHRAREELRRAVWAPPSPDAVVRLGGVDSRRHVADAPALRRIVMGALVEIAAQMRGARPLAPALWNTKPYRLPKDENEISNMLVEWLSARIGDDKAIINREVQVNPRSGQSADRTDILVQATAAGQGTLSVVVEVKGAWNVDVMTALGNQLAGKYLKPDLTDQGIYLVFWFAEEGWDDFGSESERNRRRRTTRETAPRMAELLEAQAHDVSMALDVTVDAFVIDASLGR